VCARMCACTHATSSLFVFCVTTGYQIQVQSASDFLLFHELSRLGYPQSRHGFKVFFHFLSHPLARTLSHTRARAHARILSPSHFVSPFLSLSLSLSLPSHRSFCAYSLRPVQPISFAIGTHFLVSYHCLPTAHPHAAHVHRFSNASPWHTPTHIHTHPHTNTPIHTLTPKKKS